MFVMGEHGYLCQIDKKASKSSFFFSRTATEQARLSESEEDTKQARLSVPDICIVCERPAVAMCPVLTVHA